MILRLAEGAKLLGRESEACQARSAGERDEDEEDGLALQVPRVPLTIRSDVRGHSYWFARRGASGGDTTGLGRDCKRNPVWS